MSNTSATATNNGDDDSNSPIGDTALGGFGYGVGLSVAVLAIFVVITYFSYKCKKSSHQNSLSFSSSSSSFRSRYFAGDHSAAASVQVVVHSDGLDSAAISAIPLYTYAQLGVHGGGGCAVCLGEYKESEEVRLMPECGHVFHRSCIDPWLMIHSTCPICRNTPVAAVVMEQPATVTNQ